MLRARRITALVSIAAAIAIYPADARADDDVALDRWKAFMPIFGPATGAFLVAYAPLVGAGAPALFRTTENIFFGSSDNGGLQLLVPIAGPFLFAANHPHDSTINPNGLDVSPTMRTLLIADGITQGVSAALMLVGVLAGHREGDEHIAHDTTEARARFFTITPLLTPTTAGVAATITAF